jgi:hypothetical protein
MSNAVYPSQVKGLSVQIMKTPEFRTLDQTASNGASVSIPQYVNPIWHFTLVYNYLDDLWLSPNNTLAYAPYTDFQTLMGFFLARRGKGDDFLFLDSTDYSPAGVRGGVWRPNTLFPTGSVIIDRNGHAQLATTGGTSGTDYPQFSTGGTTTTDGVTTVTLTPVIWTDQGFFPKGWPNAPVQLSVVQDAAGNYYSPIQRSVGGLFTEDITDLVPNTLQVYENGSPTPQFAPYRIGGPGLGVPGASYGGLYLAWTNAPTQPVTATFQFYFRLKFEEDTQDFEQWLQNIWTIGGEGAKNGSGMLKFKTNRNSAV